jgi:hypothetical protein
MHAGHESTAADAAGTAYEMGGVIGHLSDLEIDRVARLCPAAFAAVDFVIASPFPSLRGCPGLRRMV